MRIRTAAKLPCCRRQADTGAKTADPVILLPLEIDKNNRIAITIIGYSRGRDWAMAEAN